VLQASQAGCLVFVAPLVRCCSTLEQGCPCPEIVRKASEKGFEKNKLKNGKSET
jgi:hypothetical protein